MTKKVVRKPSRLLHLTLMILYLIPCMVIFGLGVLLCLTIIGIAPGVFLIVLSGQPLAAESIRYINRQVEWEKYQEGPDKFRTGPGKRNAVVIKLDADIEEYEYDPDLDQMVPIQKPWVE